MQEHDRISRRTALRATGGVLAAGMLAGCSADSGNGNGNGNGNGGEPTTTEADGATVAVGPNSQLVFEPEEVTIATGETVVWEFESPGHNVAAWPDMNMRISVPDGAGFGSMAQDGNAYETLEAGETFEHTFETAGEYTYVCMPHVSQGMVGTVVVEE